MKGQTLELALPSKPIDNSNEEDYYIKGLINNDGLVIEEIYNNYFPTIKKLVVKNSGSDEEAFDVFQDGLLIVLDKIKKSDFQLTSCFHTFLYSICRFVWLRQLKKNRRKVDNYLSDEIIDNDLDKDIDDRLKMKLFKSKLEMLSPESKKVLELFFNKTPMEKIATEMGYTLEYARRKKYKAKNKLVQLIKADKEFHLYYN